MKRIIKIAILMLITCIFLILDSVDSYVASDLNQSFIVDVEVGYDGLVVEDEICPLKISINNLQDDFRGTIIINEGGKKKSFNLINEEKLTIKKGKTKVITSYLEYIKNGENSVICQIKDESGKIVYEKEVVVEAEVTYHLRMGVISGNEIAFDDDYIITTKYNDCVIDLISLDNNDIHTVKNALDIFDVLFITNSSNELLDESKIQAIEEWIDRGGNLIIATGSDAGKFNTTFKNISKYFTLEDFKEREICNYRDEKLVAESYKVTSDNNINEVCASKQYGKGNIIVLGYNFEEQKILDYMSLYDYMYRITMDVFLSDIFYDNDTLGGEGIYIKDEMLVDLPYSYNTVRNKEFQLSSVVYVVIINVYIFILLPVVFTIAVKNKRKNTYIAMSSLAIVVGAIVYILGDMSRPHETYEHYLNIVTEDTNGEVSNQCYINVNMDDSGEYKKEISKDLELEKGNGNGSGIANTTIFNKIDSTELVIDKAEPYSSRNFKINYTNKKNVQLDVQLYKEITDDLGSVKYSGSIKNLSDVVVEDICIFEGNEYWYIPRINVNETVNIEKGMLLTGYNLYEGKGLESNKSKMDMSRRYTILKDIETFNSNKEYHQDYNYDDIKIIYFTEKETEDIYINDNESLYGISVYIKSVMPIDKETGYKTIREYPNVYSEDIEDIDYEENLLTISCYDECDSFKVNYCFDNIKDLDRLRVEMKEDKYHKNRYEGEIFITGNGMQKDISDICVENGTLMIEDIEKYISSDNTITLEYKVSEDLELTNMQIYNLIGETDSTDY